MEATPGTVNRAHAPGYGIPEGSEGLLPWDHVVHIRLTLTRS